MRKLLKGIAWGVFCPFILFSVSCQDKENTVQYKEGSVDIAVMDSLPTRPNHIVIVVEENHGFDQIIGSKDAPFINELAQKSALFINAHGTNHPSQPNYLVLFSGSNQGVKDDHCLVDEAPFSTPNLAASLLSNGLTFKGYAQTMPSPGYKGCHFKRSKLTKGYLYARKHAPWVNWQGTGTNNFPDSLSLPMSEFPNNFNKLPTVAFVIPNQDFDMHNIGTLGDAAAISRADNWLEEKLQEYIQWAQDHNSLFILTFDEDDFKPQNHIVTLFYGAGVKQGRYTQKINHYDVLKTIERMYHLPFTGNHQSGLIDGIW